MSVIVYTSSQLERLTTVELQRIATELGLIGLEGRSQLTSHILQWQSGKHLYTPSEFSAGMLAGPALEAYAQLLEYYDTKKKTARLLIALSPLAFEGVIQLLAKVPALPTSPHSLRVAYLLMHDQLEITIPTGKGPVITAAQRLQRYFKHKDWIYRYLLELNDATLFSVVDQYGSDLVIAEPYVQINGVRYDDRLAVAYYLVTLQVR